MKPLVYSKKEISAIKKEIYFGGSVKIIEFAKEINIVSSLNIQTALI